MKTTIPKTETLAASVLRDAVSCAAVVENMLRDLARNLIMFEPELAGSFAAIADEVQHGSDALGVAFARHSLERTP